MAVEKIYLLDKISAFGSATMDDFIKELKNVRKSLEHAIDAADEMPVAERTLKDLKEAQSLIESVIRRNKAQLSKDK